MHEFKFKLWNKNLKRFEKYFILDSEGDIRVGILPEEESEFDLNCDFEIIQFTGLIDKNNQQIYYGDIVKENYGKFIVNKITVAMWILEINKMNCLDLEILGNIYENQELIGN